MFFCLFTVVNSLISLSVPLAYRTAVDIYKLVLYTVYCHFAERMYLLCVQVFFRVSYVQRWYQLTGILDFVS